MYTPTYIGEISLDEETLAHYGVKGMKWGKRKARLKGKYYSMKSKLAEKRAKINRKLRGFRDDYKTNGYGKHPDHAGYYQTDKDPRMPYGAPLESGNYQRGLAAARQRARVNYKNSSINSTPRLTNMKTHETFTDYYSLYNNRQNQARTDDEKRAMKAAKYNVDSNERGWNDHAVNVGGDVTIKYLDRSKLKKKKKR